MEGDEGATNPSASFLSPAPPTTRPVVPAREKLGKNIFGYILEKKITLFFFYL